jgi:hypothetical protein
VSVSRTELLFLAAVVAVPAWLCAGPVLREPGAVYLEDIVSKPVKLNVPVEAPIFFDLGMGRYLGTLKKGQLVELQAVTDQAYRVRGQAQQGQVAGWVDPKYLGALKPDFLDNIKKAAKRLEEVKVLIARKEVAINMTPAEVTSSLGKAPKITSRIDAAGRHEIWEYIKYEFVPQMTTGRDQFGNIFTNTIYIKVPVGSLSVVFDNSLVTAIEQSEGSLTKAGQVKMVPGPIEVY